MCGGKGVGRPPHRAQRIGGGQELAVGAGNSSSEDADACRCSEKQGGGGQETVSLLRRLRTEKRPLALIRKR